MHRTTAPRHTISLNR